MTQLEIAKQTTADGFLMPTDSHFGSNTEIGEYDDGLSPFLALRRDLFGIAYRMLGSAAEAEDVVQDVWLRWHSTNRSVVFNPPAFLMTTTMRMCINLRQSAHWRREIYIGEWFSDPVDSNADPALAAVRGEALRSAIFILLERLRPAERTAYILRVAFDYSYRKIAGILRMKEPNVRQLLTRARRHIAEGRGTLVSSTERRRLLAAFMDAAQNGNLTALEGLLVSDVACYSDGRRHKVMSRASRIDPEWAVEHLSLYRKTRKCLVATKEEAVRKETSSHGEGKTHSISFRVRNRFGRTVGRTLSKATPACSG